MQWWIWILFGLGLLALEVALPGGIVMLFFGVAAILVGVLVALGVGGPLWLQWLLFSVISIVSLLVLRSPILKMLGKNVDSEPIDSLVGKQVEVLTDIAPGSEGKVELRGAPWIAQNVGDRSLAIGQKCVVERVDGIKLSVKAT